VVADAVADAKALEPAADRGRGGGGVAVTGDEDRLRQVVGNLFANVRVHTPAEAPVSVALTTTDGRAGSSWPIAAPA
jgi:two-component system OmpR family sensor kinase